MSEHGHGADVAPRDPVVTEVRKGLKNLQGKIESEATENPDSNKLSTGADYANFVFGEIAPILTPLGPLFSSGKETRTRPLASGRFDEVGDFVALYDFEKEKLKILRRKIDSGEQMADFEVGKESEVEKLTDDEKFILDKLAERGKFNTVYSFFYAFGPSNPTQYL